MTKNLQDLIPKVIEVARLASKAILDVYNSNENVEVKTKKDFSPVTKADIESSNIIKGGLLALTPYIPVVTEEEAIPDYSVRKEWKSYWLVDPLDGTKEFLHRTDEFTINIALIENGEPVLGVVLVPTRNTVYFGLCKCKAYKQIGDSLPEVITISDGIGIPIRVTISRHHGNNTNMQDILQQFGDIEVVVCGSTLKLCLIAEGAADLYPRFGPTSEWDTAAGQCILEAAGGKITDLQGCRLKYNKESLINPNFVAYSQESVIKNIIL